MECESMRSFFLRHPSLGAPFINAFSVKGSFVSEEKISIPVMICSEFAFAKISSKFGVQHRYCGHPSFIKIISEKQTELAHCVGKVGWVLLYRIFLKNDFSFMKGHNSLLANLKISSKKHSEVEVKIARVRGLFTVYGSIKGSYLTFEYLYD